MKKIFFLLLCPLIFAQYTKDDSNLIQTTFTKNFDKPLIEEYLQSGNIQKINAALLSIAQSEDTNWVKQIILIDFKTHAREICFALGQLGNCKTSLNFVTYQLSRNNITLNERTLLNKTFGKVCSIGDTLLFKSYFRTLIEESLPPDGIPEAIYEMSIRGIFSWDFNKILTDIFLSENSSSSIRNSILFTLSRISRNSELNQILADSLKKKIKNTFLSENKDIFYIQCVLTIFRRTKFFPDDIELIKTLLSSSNWFIREESIKAIVYFSKWNQENLNIFLNCLTDKNPNVSRQTAISMKELQVDSLAKIYLKQELIKYLDNSELTANTKGEVFISYVILFKPDMNEFLANYESKVKNEFVYRAMTENSSKMNYPYGFFESKYKIEGLRNKIHIMQGILSLQNNFDTLIFFQNFLIEHIKSKDLILAGIVAEELSERLINQRKLNLMEAIEERIRKEVNNFNASEVCISLYNLAGKLDTSFQKKLLNEFEFSEVYSLRKFAFKELNKNTKGITRSLKLIDTLVSYAFSFQRAKINTSKGFFTIEFLPEVAPISVGNFCYLAKNNKINGNIFHRVVPGFVIQTGDPTGTGWSGPGYEINSENSYLSFQTGYVGMASSGKDTEGSQWFVTQANYPHLDGRYTIFARVVAGIETVFNIDQYDEIISIDLE